MESNNTGGLFNKNLTEYQNQINNFILRICISGGVLGTLSLAFLKKLNILTRLTWSDIIKFAIFALIGTLISVAAYFIFARKSSNKLYINIFKYILITCSYFNYYALVDCIPYREMWGTIFFAYFISTFYLEIKAVVYSIGLSIIVCIIQLISNPYFLPQSDTIPELVLRGMAISFGASSALITAILSKKLLMNSSQNEFKSIQSFNTLESVFKKAEDISKSLTCSSEQIATLAMQQNKSCGEMAGNSSEVSQGAEQTASSIKESTDLLSTLVSGIQSVLNKASDSIEISKQLQAVTQDGKTSIIDATDKMESIKESVITTSQSTRQLDSKAKEIDSIVEFIKQISNQTNLLALNASIEASRAGVHGKGFAVVAEEIRKLAEQSHESLKAITLTLKQIIEHSNNVDILINTTSSIVEEGAAIVTRSREYYDEINSNLQVTINSLTEIHTLSEEELKESKSLSNFMNKVSSIAANTSQNVEWVAAATQENLAASDELLKFAQAISEMARELMDMISSKSN